MASIRQTKAIKGVLVDGKPVSVAMREAGYPPATAKNPMVLTKSKAWLETLEKYGLTEDAVVKRHAELVRSKREEIALRAVDIAYKVQGKYEQSGANRVSSPVLIQINPPQSDNMAKVKDITE